MNGIEALFEMGMSATLLAVIVSLPVLAVSLAVGFTASFFQGLTQVQDHTLTFVPRLLAVLLALALAAQGSERTLTLLLALGVQGLGDGQLATAALIAATARRRGRLRREAGALALHAAAEFLGDLGNPVALDVQ